MTKYKIGDRVKIISKEKLRRIRHSQDSDDYDEEDDNGYVVSDMLPFGGKIGTITDVDEDDCDYKISVDDGYSRWDEPLLTLLPPKQPKLIKMGNCICGHKNTKLINIQGDYICEQCIQVIFNTYKSKSMKKMAALKSKTKKHAKGMR